MSAVLAGVVANAPMVPLSEVADLVRGVSYPKRDAREEPAPGFIPMLRATNIQDARLVLDSDLVFVAERNVSPDQLLRQGDIIVATSSGSKHLVGKSGHLHAAWLGSFGAFCATVRPRPGIHPRYLALFLQAPAYWRQITKKALGVNINNLRLGDLKSVELPLPPLDVQESIVAELEKQFSCLDKAVANLMRVTASILRYRASILAEAAGANGRWPTCRIAELLCEPILNGLSVKESQAPTAVRALRLSAMSEAGLDYADHRFLPVESTAVEDIVVREGDFFVSRGNGSLALVGRGAIAQRPPFPVIFPDTMMRLRFADGNVRRWVAMLWPSRLVRRQIEQRVKTTAGIYKIAQPQVASICVPIPPVSDREGIVAEVERRLSIARSIDSETTLSLQRASRLRQAALCNVFDQAEAPT